MLLQTRLFRQIEKVRKTVSRMTTVQVELAHISDSAVVGLIDVGVWNECAIDTELYNCFSDHCCFGLANFREWSLVDL